MDDLIEWVMTGAGNRDHQQGVEIEFNQLFERIKIELKSLIEPKQILVLNHSDPKLRIDNAISTLSVVLRNTLMNAIKFSNKQTEVHVKAFVEGRFFNVNVRDFGMGMTGEQLKVLFTAKTSSNIGTEGESGHGMGLLLCHELLERVGGSIHADSDLERVP